MVELKARKTFQGRAVVRAVSTRGAHQKTGHCIPVSLLIARGGNIFQQPSHFPGTSPRTYDCDTFHRTSTSQYISSCLLQIAFFATCAPRLISAKVGSGATRPQPTIEVGRSSANDFAGLQCAAGSS